MILNSLCVKGELSLSLSFTKLNIILGENKTGKTTLLKLILYSLGTRVDSFIEEISRLHMCKQVELIFTTKNNKVFKAIRSLPYSETVVLMPIYDGVLAEGEIEAYTTAEYSDFILAEEGYKNHTIPYGNDKKATMRFYHLLRAVIADQDTSAHKIFADLGGNNMEYLNNQLLVKKAIIETILGDDNERIHKLRLELQTIISSKKALVNKINITSEMVDTDLAENKDLSIDVIKLNKRIEEIKAEKNEVSTSNVAGLKTMESENNKLYEDKINNLKAKENEIVHQLRKLMMESSDIQRVIDRLKREVEQLKQMIVARQVITKIPVEHCPVCLSAIALASELSSECPFCNKVIDNTEIDKVARYKTLLEESLSEAKEVKEDIIKEINELTVNKDKFISDINKIRTEYFDKIENTNNPIDSLVSALAVKLELLSKKEEQLRNFKSKVEFRGQLKEQKIKLDTKEQQLRDELGEIEQDGVYSKENKLAKWNQVFCNTLSYIFKDINNANIDTNYQPYVDGIEVKNISSASLKVATRLSYILSLHNLQQFEAINHVGLCFFDSPKDKDLDTDKYQRFLRLISETNVGQIFLTGSIKDQHLYQLDDIICTLHDADKLLKH